MNIVICKDCGKIIKPTGALYTPHPDSLCGDERSQRLNFVTGEKYLSRCDEINFNGDCEWFEGIENQEVTV